MNGAEKVNIESLNGDLTIYRALLRQRHGRCLAVVDRVSVQLIRLQATSIPHQKISVVNFIGLGLQMTAFFRFKLSQVPTLPSTHLPLQSHEVIEDESQMVRKSSPSYWRTSLMSVGRRSASVDCNVNAEKCVPEGICYHCINSLTRAASKPPSSLFDTISRSAIPIHIVTYPPFQNQGKST
jgi:hypothetical protein